MCYKEMGDIILNGVKSLRKQNITFFAYLWTIQENSKDNVKTSSGSFPEKKKKSSVRAMSINGSKRVTQTKGLTTPCCTVEN